MSAGESTADSAPEDVIRHFSAAKQHSGDTMWLWGTCLTFGYSHAGYMHGLRLCRYGNVLIYTCEQLYQKRVVYVHPHMDCSPNAGP